MKTTIESQVIKHGLQLIELFNLPTSTDPVKLCKQLRRIENKANQINEQYCNGDIDGEKHEFLIVNIELKVKSIFNSNKFKDAFYFNSDPRGYALKLRFEWAQKNARDFYKDWGGYGILAPEFK
jgi:hypothetical protein